MIRIAHVTYDMDVGGAETVIAHLASRCDPKRFETRLYCTQGKIGALGRSLVKKGIHIETFGRRPGFDRRLVARLAQKTRDDRLDILHCHQYTPFVYGAIGSLRTRAKVVFTEHGRFHPDCLRAKRVLANALLSHLTARITTISEATREALVRYERFPRKRIEVIYNGIDLGRIDGNGGSVTRGALGIEPGAFVLGTVARLDSIKNQAMMIRALGAIAARHPEAVLLVVGEGPERVELERLSRQEGLEGKVILVGHRTDALSFYPLFDVFLLTSFSEGTAMTILEAMAAEVPCVVTDVGGNPELVSDGVNGFLVKSEDVAGLAAKLECLLANREEGRRLGREGRLRVQQRHSVEGMVAAYERLYAEVVQS